MAKRYAPPHKTEHQHYEELCAAAGRRLPDRDYYAVLRDEADAIGAYAEQQRPRRDIDRQADEQRDKENRQ